MAAQEQAVRAASTNLAVWPGLCTCWRHLQTIHGRSAFEGCREPASNTQSARYMQRGTARGALQSNAGSRKASEYHRGLMFGGYRRYLPVAAASITSTAGGTLNGFFLRLLLLPIRQEETLRHLCRCQGCVNCPCAIAEGRAALGYMQP